MVRRVGGPLLVAALLWLAPGGAAAAAVDADESVGVQHNPMANDWWPGYGAAKAGAVLDKVVEAGAGWVRIWVEWYRLEPEQGDVDPAYEAEVTAALDRAVARGLSVLAVVEGVPPWANGGRFPRHTDGVDPLAVAGAFEHAASRWAGQVDAWEVFNEPNSRLFSTASVDEYVLFLAVASTVLGLWDPEAPVVLGGAAWADAAWLDAVYQAGGAPWFDVVAWHPYNGDGTAPETPCEGKVHRLTCSADVRAVQVAHDDADTPVWFTELGWSAGNHGVTEATKAAYLRRAWAHIRRAYPWVERVFWYDDVQDWPGTDHFLSGYGLLEFDLTERASYRAFGEVTGAFEPVQGEDPPPPDPDPSPK